MSSERIPKRIGVFKSRQAQPDQPHDAAQDMSLALETAALVWRGAGNSRHFIFPSADEAPVASLTAVSTPDYFWLGDTSTTHDFKEFNVPWRVTEGFERVGAIMVCGLFGNAALEAWLRSATLVDSVATVVGDAAPARSWVLNAVASWRLEEYSWRTLQPTSTRTRPYYVMFMMDITPNLPASRVVQVVPRVQLTANNDLVDLGGEVRVYLRELYLFDLPGPEVPV